MKIRTLLSRAVFVLLLLGLLAPATRASADEHEGAHEASGDEALGNEPGDEEGGLDEGRQGVLAKVSATGPGSLSSS